MASLCVLAFDHEGRPIQFDTWLDDLQLYLLSDSRGSVLLFDHMSSAAPAPPATADSATRSQWLTCDAATRLAIRNHLQLAECAHFGQHRTAQALYDAVVAHYSSSTTTSLGRLLLPYLFPELSAFATIEDLVSHLRTSDARYRAALPAEFLDRNPPPMDHFLSLDPTVLSIDLLEQQLLAGETSVIAVGAARGTPRTPFFEGTSGLLLLVQSTAAVRARVAGVVAVAAGVVVGPAVEVVEAVEVVAAVGVVAGVGALVAVVAAVGVVAVRLELSVERGASRGSGSCPYVIHTGDRDGLTCGKPHTQHRCFSRLDDAWRTEFGDKAKLPRWAELLSAEGDCYLCVPPDPGIEAAALGASEYLLPGTVPAEALHTFTRDSGASRWSSLYTLATEPPQVAASAQVSASSQVAPPCSCRLLSHQTLLRHHRLGHPSLPRLCGMHSRLLVSGLPRSLPPLQPSPAPPCLPCVEGQQRAAPHSSLFPPTTAPLETLHMDVWGPARVNRQGRECYLLLVSIFGGRLRSGWQFYHPTLRRVFPSQDVTFDDSVPFYRLFPYRYAPSPPPPLFLAPGPAPSEGTRSGGAEPGGTRSGGAEPGGAEPGGAELASAEPAGVEPGGAEPEGVEPGGAASEGAESGCAEPQDTASSGGPAGASPRLSPRPEPLSPQQLREWFAHRTRLWSGASGAGDSAAGDTGAGNAGVTAGAGGTGGAAGAGHGGARTRGTGAAGIGGVGGTGAGDPTEPGAAGAGGAGAVGARAGGTGAGGAGARGAGANDPRAGGAGGTVRPRAYFVPLLQQQPPLQPPSPLPAPSPYTEQIGGLTERRELASRPASPVHTSGRVPRPRPHLVPSTHAMALRPSSVPLRVPLLAPPESSLPAVPDPESDRTRAASPTVSSLLATVVTDPSFESIAVSSLVAELCALGTDVLKDREEDFECLAAAVPRFASMLLAPEGDPDALDIPTPYSCAEAITCPYSSQWQAAMDTEMASWKSTGTYVNAVPPSRANIVDGMWIFRVKGPSGSPPAFKERYIARGFSQRQAVDYFQTFSPTPKTTTLRVLLHIAAQRDYELHSLDFSTAFLQGSLHEEIWLRRPPGFTGSFPAGIQWSLRRPVYGLCQAPREWHDTLRTTLAALGFTPSTADPSL
ncbi:unnamed protein product [Closterium sp. NIES-53]